MSRDKSSFDRPGFSSIQHNTAYTCCMQLTYHFRYADLVVSSDRSSLNIYHPLTTLVTVVDSTPPTTKNITKITKYVQHFKVTTSKHHFIQIVVICCFITMIPCVHKVCRFSKIAFNEVAWTQHLHIGQRMEFLPILIWHTSQGNIPDFYFVGHSHTVESPLVFCC